MCVIAVALRSAASIVVSGSVDGDHSSMRGTMLDAQLSRALMLNIFTPWPDNLLHDGAIIIRDGLVEQAGAVLPLTHNLGLDKALGTRHRAAVGITEETDALAVVVSEQRGTISLAVGGMLHTGLNQASLRRELLARLTAEALPPWYVRWFRKLEARFASDKSGAAPSSRNEKGAEVEPR